MFSSVFLRILIHFPTFFCFLVFFSRFHISLQCKNQGSLGNLRIPPVLTCILLLSPVFSRSSYFTPYFPVSSCFPLNQPVLSAVFLLFYPVLPGIILYFPQYSPLSSYFARIPLYPPIPPVLACILLFCSV